ncbi:chloride channel protein [Lapillicoccus jejuensis]|uniref:chloride channel protein n=1 Tax=Lapillicoccus jejuensis TaxID=402171 RepID=UPI001FE57324|nr:chloride channel protein [Lapillicoccus jejuensis]
MTALTMRVDWARARGLRSRRLGLLLLALGVGVGAGLGAVAFRYMIEGLTHLFTGFSDYAGHPGAANPQLPALGRFFVVLTPVVAGLVYGPLVQRFAREARGHGVPEVMVAVARHGGRIRPQVALVKAVASALCIGGGGSVGREGPIVQIGSALGSTLGQSFKLDERRVTLLVACGAAGGISATFNAPLAGVFFAMELILRQWAAESFGMVVLSSVTASVIGRGVLGDSPFLVLPAFHVDHLAQYPLFALLGVLAGLVGVGFSRVLYAVEDACDWAWRGPEWLRPATGGLLLGLVLLVLPQMYGVGYPVLGRAVDGGYGIAFLLVLLVGKLVACSLTIGIGGSGGVFAPSLFVGAMAGAAFGEVVHSVAPTSGGSVGAYALIGMGAVFAGAARAPITAVVILFELTGEYSIILPLMLAIVLATGISQVVSRDTVYTRKLLRRGIDIDEPADAAVRRRPAAPFVTPAPAPLRVDDTLEAAAARFAAGTDAELPVVEADGRLHGTVTATDVVRALSAGDDTRVGALASPADPVPDTATVGDVLTALGHARSVVPVADASGAVVGWVRERDLLGTTGLGRG